MLSRLLRDKKELERLIIDYLKSREMVSFIEVSQSLPENADLRVARRVFADLVKKGVVERIPDYEKGRVLYRLKRS